MQTKLVTYSVIKSVKAGNIPNKRKRIPLPKEDTEFQPHSLTSIYDHIGKMLNKQPGPSTSETTTKVAPLILQNKLKEDYGIDISSCEKFTEQRCQKLKKTLIN